MKIFIRKGLLLNGCLLVFAALVWLACQEDSGVTYDQGSATDIENADPYVQVVTSFVPFEAGTEKYGITFNVLNGTKAITSVKLYGLFTDAESGITSNEVLYGEYPIESPLRTVVTDSLTYDELKAGLTLDGNPMPATDADVFGGSGWAFRFEGVYASGEPVVLVGAVNMVLSKYAGNYVVSNSTYMRIQVDVGTFPGEGVAHWDGEEVFIGFVDQTTLSYNDRWGYFSTPGCSWNFSYDEGGVITDIPILVTGVCASLAAAPASCKDNKAGFNNLSAYLGYDVCTESNVIIDNIETGEHVMKLTYGYIGAGGTRQFTETLTKIVD